MNADQKQRATELLLAWRATAYGIHADAMVALLQELVDAPEAEPVAKVLHVDGLLSNNLLDCDLPVGTLLYTAPPAPVESYDGPDFSDGCELEGFPGGCARMGCHKPKPPAPNAPVCKTCNDTGECNDAEPGDMLYNSWPCPDCNQAEAAAPTPRVPDGWRDVLEAVLREMPARKDNNGNAPGHGHRIPGIWDSDNGPLAGKPCAWCLTWNKAKKLLAATPTPPEPPADVARDAERLDWLDRNLNAFAETGIPYGSNIRNAIDAARKRQGGE